MKRVSRLILAIGLLILTHLTICYAGPPFNNLEGVGGVAFNPLAYTAGTSFTEKGETLSWKEAFSEPPPHKDIFAKPQIGGWYIHLPSAAVDGADWTTLSIADSFFYKRLEVSYGFENVNLNKDENIHKHSVGAKLLLVKENYLDKAFIPAVSVGGIYKWTSASTDLDSSGWDFYAVATKTITQLPVPVLLSAGVLSTSGVATGVLGFDHGRRYTFFGNIDFIPIKQVVIGFEYKQGARFAHVNNASYFDVHAAWLVTRSLSLIGAYVNAGSSSSTSKVGLGSGLVLSAQYAF